MKANVNKQKAVTRLVTIQASEAQHARLLRVDRYVMPGVRAALGLSLRGAGKFRFTYSRTKPATDARRISHVDNSFVRFGELWCTSVCTEQFRRLFGEPRTGWWVGFTRLK